MSHEEMVLAAAGIGAAVAVPALFLIYRQVAARRGTQGALRDAEARMGGLVESAMDAVVTVDEEQRVVQFNAAAENVFRWPRNAVIGQRLDMLLPEAFRAAHRQHIERFGATATTSRGMGRQMVIRGLRADGTEFPIEASISQHAEDGRKRFTVIVRDVTERVRAEEALLASRQEVRDLALAASNLREQEKKRIARELHDELGQALTALKLDASWLREHLATTDEAVKQKLVAMQALLDATVAATRRISSDLRPLILDDLGLAAAAEWLAETFSARTGVPCELIIERGDLDLPDVHGTTVFRILQESLTNVAKHAMAKKVEVTFDRTPGEVRLTVRDDGRGFDTGAPTRANAYGLLGVRERAGLLGGEVRVASTPGRGTTVELRLPLDETRAGA